METYKKDSRIILVLLIALVLQIGALLWHLNLLPWTRDQINLSEQQWAGKIISVQKDLQRRGQNSLIWEGSREDERLYFYDSLLTLKESEATIELQNKTRITIGENTLISIEPPQQDKPQEITVQFSKGRFSARNPYNTTQVKENRLSLTLSPGSEVEISKDNEDYTEIDVKEGGIELEVDGKKTIIQENKWVAIEGKKIIQKDLDTQLDWTKAPPKRHYIHGKTVTLDFEWKGQATALKIKDQEEEEEELKPLTIEQTQQSLSFKPGEYQLRLVGENKLGPSFILQIWQAPTLHLLKPEPRNRISFGEQRFIWTPLNTTANYELRIKGTHTSELVKSQDNEAHFQFDKEDDVQWEVWGVDSDGFKIPPAYQYPLFIRESPFAAPKLFQPQAVPPKSSQHKKQNFWLDFFISKAYAKKEEPMGALLTWQSIPGADLYVVEISDSIDFRSLIHSQEVQTNKYVFTHLSASDKLYWRVAAGSNAGRMGVFSDPALLTFVELSTLQESKKPKKKEKVQSTSEKMQTPISKNKLPPKKSPPSHQPVQKLESNSNEPRVPFALLRTWIWGSTGYSQAQLTTTTGTKINLNGPKPLALGFQMDFQWSSQRKVRLLSHFSQNDYAPKPTSLYPFQSEIENIEISFRALTYKENSWWVFGVQGTLLPKPQQIDFERVDLATQLALGAVVGIHWENGNIDYLGLLTVLVPPKGVTLNSLQRFVYKVQSWWFVGVELEVTYSIDGLQNSLQSYDGRVLTGFEF